MAELSRTERLARLDRARLYLVTDAEPGAGPLADVLVRALHGGVDIVQLRMKDAADDAIRAAAQVVRRVAHEHRALFVLNDRPDLAKEVGADGVHVGQDDHSVEQARALAGPSLLVGLSTHAPDDLDGAWLDRADYAGVGPVHATPTKPGRPAAGLEYVRHAAASAATLPWFAIGGIDTTNVAAVRAAGASRIAVVRAIADAPDLDASGAAARALRAAITQTQEDPVGTP
ncbi:thiamine phosphate synthase [Conexibacter sp. W3-3-2]|uniref:thiamine phosphate synthase n=1 Tax=Conexibacter sp. W3-3-2 TaxID=2675227 RepID=UPI0012BA18B9|nr:thiamine phosphate synthase [Conexibacter sp. W3-3-2]MTD45294.1 thiamine phosphate synthase [Conexibacter sp. W3-3-2]